MTEPMDQVEPRIVRPESVKCFVFSFKDGLLSRLAHDLKLEAKKLSLELDANQAPISLRIDANHFDLVGQIENGSLKAGAVSDSDRQKILSHLRNEVLDAKRYPEIVFVFDTCTHTPRGWDIRGKLTLHGRTKSISTTTRREGDHEVVEVTLDQTDFGITPFSAMLGALKVKAEVKVRVEIWVE